jgi:hypothetical protein
MSVDGLLALVEGGTDRDRNNRGNDVRKLAQRTARLAPRGICEQRAVERRRRLVGATTFARSTSSRRRRERGFSRAAAFVLGESCRRLIAR